MLFRISYLRHKNACTSMILTFFYEKSTIKVLKYKSLVSVDQIPWIDVVSRMCT